MEEIPVLQAVFNPEMWEQVKGYQGELIRLFKDFTNKLLVLHGQREADAIPVMIIIVEFMEKWLHVGHFNDSERSFRRDFQRTTRYQLLPRRRLLPRALRHDLQGRNVPHPGCPQLYCQVSRAPPLALYQGFPFRVPGQYQSHRGDP